MLDPASGPYYGIPWEQSVANAAASCRIMIFVFADYFRRSDRIERQLECAFNSGAIIIPFRTESVTLVSSSGLGFSALARCVDSGYGYASEVIICSGTGITFPTEE